MPAPAAGFDAFVAIGRHHGPDHADHVIACGSLLSRAQGEGVDVTEAAEAAALSVVLSMAVVAAEARIRKDWRWTEIA